MKNNSLFRISYTAVLAAMVCVLTFLRIPFLGSKVHMANAMCLISGLLLGGVSGGISAGLGSALYDALWGGYDLLQCLITFASKFMMAYICSLLVNRKKNGNPSSLRMIIACICGSATYIILYMLKTYVFQRYVYGYPLDTVWATMLSKLPASLINGLFAIIVAPTVFSALDPVMQRQGFYDRLS